MLIVFSKVKKIVESEIGVWEHLNHLHRLERFMCYDFERYCTWLFLSSSKRLYYLRHKSNMATCGIKGNG